MAIKGHRGGMSRKKVYGMCYMGLSSVKVATVKVATAPEDVHDALRTDPPFKVGNNERCPLPTRGGVRGEVHCASPHPFRVSAQGCKGGCRGERGRSRGA